MIKVDHIVGVAIAAAPMPEGKKRADYNKRHQRGKRRDRGRDNRAWKTGCVHG